MNLALLWAYFIWIAQCLFLSSSFLKLRINIKWRESHRNPVLHSFEKSQISSSTGPVSHVAASAWRESLLSPRMGCPLSVPLSPASNWVHWPCCTVSCSNRGSWDPLEKFVSLAAWVPGHISLWVGISLVLLRKNSVSKYELIHTLWPYVSSIHASVMLAVWKK